MATSLEDHEKNSNSFFQKVLADLTDEIASDLNESDSTKLKKIITDKSLSIELIQRLQKYLITETDLANFAIHFKNVRNIQICFLVDTSQHTHHANFKNTMFATLIDAVLSDINVGKKSYAFLGYGNEDEKEFVQFTDDIEQVRSVIRAVGEKKRSKSGVANIELAFKRFVDNVLFKGRGTRVIIHIAEDPIVRQDDEEYMKSLTRLLTNIANNLNCVYWFVKVSAKADDMIAVFNTILKSCIGMDPGMNRINEIDMRSLKSDLTLRVKHLLNDKVFQPSPTT